MIKPEIRERYLKDILPVRLGGVAANLARIVSFSDHPKSAPVVTSLLEESLWFVEWSAPDLLPERAEEAAQLVDIARELTRWHRIWNDAQNDPAKRSELAQQAQHWSDEVLKMSGLLEE